MFAAWPSQAARNSGYCSHLCVGVKLRRSVALVCRTCQREFLVRRCMANRGQVYCSRSCARGIPPGELGSLSRVCQWCKKGFNSSRSKVQGGKARFCSRTCSGKWRAAHGVLPNGHVRSVAFDREVAELFSAGWSIHDIAGLLGCSHSPVAAVVAEGHLRKTEKHKERVRAKWDAWRVQYVSQSGWPEHLSIRAVQILNCLAAVGVPLTWQELAVTIATPGMARLCHNRRRNGGKASPGPLGQLLADQLILVLPNYQNRRIGYALSPKALAILEDRAKCETVMGEG